MTLRKQNLLSLAGLVTAVVIAALPEANAPLEASASAAPVPVKVSRLDAPRGAR